VQFELIGISGVKDERRSIKDSPVVDEAIRCWLHEANGTLGG
jgi:hypothetical protein